MRFDFTSPRKLIAWAETDIDKGFDLFLAWAQENITCSIEPGQSADETIMRFSSESLPEEIERCCHNASNHVRHAFDQATYSLMTVINSNFAGDAYFPWSTTPADMRGKLNRLGVPSDYQTLFAQFQPYNTGEAYEGGDNTLRDFAKVANPNKHRAVIAFNPAALIARMDVQLIPGVEHNGTIEVMSGPIPFGVDCDIASFRGVWGKSITTDFEIFPVFAGSQYLDREPIFDVLAYARSRALAVVDAFAEATSQLNGRR
ncbi:hypothetical protein [Rhizobium mesosinicum]|uniref:DUF4238 domain-containing protein n=1 Tax=Rhizobium mesosinicum TaxID=335017 RepID=A0ABS7GY42_9HYPH|nr:hypothetical protein [Rhizobium mesosinicum]MBW9054908.1 hypothetical protein [Rhizobium mesosinicum]